MWVGHVADKAYGGKSAIGGGVVGLIDKRKSLLVHSNPAQLVQRTIDSSGTPGSTCHSSSTKVGKSKGDLDDTIHGDTACDFVALAFTEDIRFSKNGEILNVDFFHFLSWYRGIYQFRTIWSWSRVPSCLYFNRWFLYATGSSRTNSEKRPCIDGLQYGLVATCFCTWSLPPGVARHGESPQILLSLSFPQIHCLVVAWNALSQHQES